MKGGHNKRIIKKTWRRLTPFHLVAHYTYDYLRLTSKCPLADKNYTTINWGLYFHLTNHLYLVIAYQKEIWRIGHDPYTEREYVLSY